MGPMSSLADPVAKLLAAAKQAYADAMLPNSRSAKALLEAIRAVEPDFPARESRFEPWPIAGKAAR